MADIQRYSGSEISDINKNKQAAIIAIFTTQ
jgi:hypothetical protein